MPEENGIEVSTVIFGDGMEFIEKYRANFDLVFMDIEMPVLDGMSTIKKLRQVDKSVLVVIVTNLGAVCGKRLRTRRFRLYGKARGVLQPRYETFARVRNAGHNQPQADMGCLRARAKR